MAEEARVQSESQGENYSETEDNRLPYEAPKLRKHGKVNITTTITIFDPSRFDGFPRFTDFS
ncbi:MAG: DEAD/DEAH box helicase [Nostocaceae cyanobacterium CSU_2_110]|nr:DEAD/DEAH box helicase [Nostocaceae cyanobacterium CSU_2_110]